MTTTDPPPLKTKRAPKAPSGSVEPTKAKRTTKAKTPAQATDATVAPVETTQAEPTATADTDSEDAAVSITEAATEVATEVEAATAQSDSSKAATPATYLDPFNYNESTLTLSLSFLPLVEGAAGRTVIVSVHSKNGTGKAVLPEFMAPLHESDLQLPPAVLALIERYRTVTLPKRKAEADTKAAALAAKRPVASKKGKDLRPDHVTTSATAKRVQTGVATQFKLNFNK